MTKLAIIVYLKVYLAALLAAGAGAAVPLHLLELLPDLLPDNKVAGFFQEVCRSPAGGQGGGGGVAHHHIELVQGAGHHLAGEALHLEECPLTGF